MHNTHKILILLVILFAHAACSVRDVTTKPDPKPASKPASAVAGTDKAEPKPCPPPIPHHDNLNGVLWMQSAAEYKANARQTFAAAQAMLPEALKDKKWTALVEEEKGAEDIRPLPPAVIVDVDETVLDNSSYQANLVLQDGVFDPKTWGEWTKKREARAVPGAVEFARAANDKGVKVLYVTNRSSDQEVDTRANLSALGFPLQQAEGEDLVLCQGEKQEWTSAKGTRRRELAQKYRIIMVIGDNLGDFVDNYKGSITERDEVIEKHAAWWGYRWFMLPNPTYGSWESAVIGKETDAKARNQLKRDALRQ
jgi:5'-nucleotidase (lipoprotein e(P4) family)